MSLRRVPDELHALIAVNAAMWAGEAEIYAAYFASGDRTAVTDEQWLARQCFKELHDGVVGRLASLSEPRDFESAPQQARVALTDDVVQAELTHYIAFRLAHRISRTARGIAEAVVSYQIGADWPENAALQALRAEHRRDHGTLGLRAQAFTEGGYCTLYRAGMALKGGTALDDAIATACAYVFDDEWDHMLQGIAGLAEVPLSAAQCQLLESLTVAQGRCRIRMRNAQFGHPLSEARVRELEDGAAAPLPFDYARAGLLAP